MAASGGRSAKAKGSSYERMLALWFNDAFARRGCSLQAKRALLSGGGRSDGGADIDGIPKLWIEAKRTERLNIRDALKQAEEGVQRTQDDRKPIVITRRNHEKTEDSIVALRLKDFMELCHHQLTEG